VREFPLLNAASFFLHIPLQGFTRFTQTKYSYNKGVIRISTFSRKDQAQTTRRRRRRPKESKRDCTFYHTKQNDNSLKAKHAHLPPPRALTPPT
jgi:hypothetical protein